MQQDHQVGCRQTPGFPEALMTKYPHPMGLPQVSEILIAFGYSFENSAKMRKQSLFLRLVRSASIHQTC